MTQYLGVLNPLPTGKSSFPNMPRDGFRAVIIGNESPAHVVVTVGGTSTSKTIYPGTADLVHLGHSFSGSLDFMSTVNLSNASTWPSNFLQFDGVGVNEVINESAYPLALPRNTNIGNTIPVTGSLQQLINDGNLAGTTFIESTPSGQASSSFDFTVDGQGFLAVLIAGVVQKLIQTANSGNALKLGYNGGVVEFLGGITIDSGNVTAVAGVNVWLQNIGESTNFNVAMDLGNHDGSVKFPHEILANGVGTSLAVAGNETIAGTLTSSDTVDITPGADNHKGLIIHQHSATQSVNLFEVQNSGGTAKVSVASGGSFNANSGAAITNGIATDTLTASTRVSFAAGSISAINTFTASLNNTFSLVAHGLGVVPDNVLGSESQNTVDASPGNLIYDKGGSDATNARLCWNAGATARTILCTAYKS